MDSKTKWDIRPAERGGQRYVDPPSCGGGTTGAYALTLWDTPAFGDMLFIVLCRYPFEGEKSIGALSNFAHEKLEPWEMETNDFVETLSGVMIHEFFHAFTFLGDDALGKRNFVSCPLFNPREQDITTAKSALYPTFFSFASPPINLPSYHILWLTQNLKPRRYEPGPIHRLQLGVRGSFWKDATRSCHSECPWVLIYIQYKSITPYMALRLLTCICVCPFCPK